MSNSRISNDVSARSIYNAQEPLLPSGSSTTATRAVAASPILSQAVQKVMTTQAEQSGDPQESQKAWFTALKNEVNTNPGFASNIEKLKANIDKLAADLESSITPASRLSKGGVATIATGAWALTMLQAARAFNGEPSDGQFVSLFGGQGVKIAGVLADMLTKTTNNEAVINTLRYYGLPNTIAALSFEIFKEKEELPVAVALTLGGTMAALSSVEIYSRINSAERRKPIEGPGVDFLRDVASTVMRDLEAADERIVGLNDGEIPGGDAPVNRVGTNEANQNDGVHRLIENCRHYLAGQTGAKLEESTVGTKEKVASSGYILLAAGLGGASVGLSKSPVDIYSTLSDLLSVLTAMAVKIATGGTPNNVEQMYIDLMGLTTSWLAFQGANAATGYLDNQSVINVSATVAGLGLIQMTYPSAIAQMPAEALSFITNQIMLAFGGTQNTESGAQASSSTAPRPVLEPEEDVELGLDVPADEVLDIGEPVEGQGNVSRIASLMSRGASQLATSVGQGMRAAAAKVGDTFAPRNLVALGLWGAQTDPQIKTAREEVVKGLKQDLNGMSKMLGALADGSSSVPDGLDSEITESVEAVRRFSDCSDWYSCSSGRY